MGSELKEVTAHSSDLNSGIIGWKAPSNIALIKYWGKKGLQLPANASISFTLDACATSTSLIYERLEKPASDCSFEVYVDGTRNPDFEPKIATFFSRIQTELPFLRHYHLKINTSNTFPHSSGIASSASGFAALSLCLLEMQEILQGSKGVHDLQAASNLSRLGSGSASRSIQGPLMLWGKTEEISESSDTHALVYSDIHQVFSSYHDTILLVDTGSKAVSSTVGHALLKDHPYAHGRYSQAGNHMKQLLQILKTGELPEFIRIVESEALSLHALMMSSNPYFILMKSGTLQIIERIWKFREKTGLPVCFTLDAGANVHVLYPEKDKSEIYAFIRGELLEFCHQGQHICDRVGMGARRLSLSGI